VLCRFPQAAQTTYEVFGLAVVVAIVHPPCWLQ
jgi:hypothetical protein